MVDMATIKSFIRIYAQSKWLNKNTLQCTNKSVGKNNHVQPPQILTTLLQNHLDVIAGNLFTDMASEMLYPVMRYFKTYYWFSVLLIGVLEGIAEAVAGFKQNLFW